MKLLALVVLAAAVAKGGKLYVKTGGATAYDKADRTGARRQLKAGDEVVWAGASPKDPAMLEIEAGKKKGFVHVTALTPNKPGDEPAGAEPPPLPVGDSKIEAALADLAKGSQAAKAKVPEHVKALGGDR